MLFNVFEPKLVDRLLYAMIEFLAPLCHLAAELFKCRLVRRHRQRRRRRRRRRCQRRRQL